MPDSEEINRLYTEEKARYAENPPAPCDKATSLKWLKRFFHASFPDFWEEPVARYLPAVREGTMKWQERVYPHDEALAYAKALISTMDPGLLAREFLCGVRANRPAYRTALACYHYIRNLPDHPFQRAYIGNNGQEVYSAHTCECCRYHDALSEEPKMQFWHINTDMAFFYLTAAVPHYFTLNTAITYLEEYQTLPRLQTGPADKAFFYEVLETVERSPADTTPSKLRKFLKAGLLSYMTRPQIDAFIDMLGYLNLLHKPGTNGITGAHTPLADQEYPVSMTTDFAYPVYNWKNTYGVDWAAADDLFSNLY